MKVKNLPKRIYLQIGEDCDHTDWDKIYPSHEVSWCEDKINDNDIVYSLDKRRLSNPSSDTRGLVGEIDDNYWKDLQSHANSHDILATVLHELKGLKDYAEVINTIIPGCIKKLDKERTKIVIETEKTFSDIMSMIDEFNPDSESSTYEIAVKICDFYRDYSDKTG